MKRPLIDSRKVLRSFRYAISGLFDFFSQENNARVHISAALLTVLMAYWLGCTTIEWAILILTITVVIVAEAFNTALERLADKVSIEYHPLIKAAKDIAAAGVLLAAIGACFIGGILFLPKLLHYLQM